MQDIKLFSGTANRELSELIAAYLGVPLGKITLGRFPDGEISCKIDEDVRGRDVFLIQPTCPPVNENLMELLIMIDSCKRASAERITAVIPYFGYARQDRKDEGRVPITAKLVANLITRAGADRVLTMDLHAAQIQGFFDVPVDHLYAAPVLNDHFQSSGLDLDEIVIVSPDEGSIKRALGHAKRLGGELAIIDKRREPVPRRPAGAHHRRHRRGQGRPHVRRHDQHRRLDLRGGRRCCTNIGAKEIHVACTHAVLCGPAIERLEAAGFTSLVCTDSIPLAARSPPAAAADSSAVRRPTAGRSHQAHPPQRVGQQTVPVS